MSEESVLRKLGRLRLIEVGVVKGTPARNIRVGDRLMWNYGTVTPVKAVRNASPKFVELSLLQNGKIYKRRLLKDRLVAKV